MIECVQIWNIVIVGYLKTRPLYSREYLGEEQNTELGQAVSPPSFRLEPSTLMPSVDLPRSCVI